VIVSGSTVAVGLLSMVILPRPFPGRAGLGGCGSRGGGDGRDHADPALLASLAKHQQRAPLPKRFVDKWPYGGRLGGTLGELVMRRPSRSRDRRIAIVGFHL